MITALVHTRNEREQLPGCLESLRWADEIVVADMQSNDGTREIALDFGARVIEMPIEPIVERVRNAAAAQCLGDWLMVVDADERVSPDLAKRIPSLATATDVAAYSIPRKNYFLGVWLEHGNWPDPQIRLARRKKIRWSELVHEHPIVDGRVQILPANPDEVIDHPGYATNLGAFMAKQLRYSELDAERLAAKISPPIWPWLFRRPVSEFYGRFAKEGAWRHGLHGFVWSGIMATYQFQLAAHYWEKSAQAMDVRGLRRKTTLEVLRAAWKWLR